MTAHLQFEAVQFVEPALQPGERFTGSIQTSLGFFEVESDAIAAARRAWIKHRSTNRSDVAWWLVRSNDEGLARWIADSRSHDERVLDLRSNQLVKVRA